MKIVIRSIIILLSTILFSSGCDIRPGDIYTVSGIILSVGLSLIVTFNLNGVKNKIYIKRIRENLHSIRSSFIIEFAIATIAYILNKHIRTDFSTKTVFDIEIVFSFPVLFNIIIFYAIAYFITNMISIEKLNEDIFDKINDEQ